MPVGRGVVALPNLGYYFYAAQILAIMQWWFHENKKAWAFEQHAVSLPLSEI